MDIVDVDEGVIGSEIQSMMNISVWDLSQWILHKQLEIKHDQYFSFTSMTNSLVLDHQVAVADVDEGVLEGSDMSGIHLIGFLVNK